MSTDIGHRLRYLRGKQSQPVFAETVEVSLRALQNYESGVRIPTGAVLSRIAEKCRVSVDWILTGQKSGADRVEEDGPRYCLRVDPVSARIRDLVGSMSGEDRAKVLEYVEFISKRKKGD